MTFGPVNLAQLELEILLFDDRTLHDRTLHDRRPNAFGERSLKKGFNNFN